MERVPNEDEIFKRMYERRVLIETIMKQRSSIVGHLLCHSNWFTTQIRGMIVGLSGRGRAKQVNMDGVK